MDPDIIKKGKIYNRLQDDLSRFIYEGRAMYCLTGDISYMNRVSRSVLDMKVLDSLMARLEDIKDRLIVRGAGNDYAVIKEMYPRFDFRMFCDNDPSKIGNKIDGKDVISPAEFYDKYADHYVLVNSAAANGEIVDELKSQGIPEEKILNLAAAYEKICDRQYFEKDILPVWEDEIFIDGGCYDGRTVRQFVKYCGGNYKKIYSFEPDPGNYLRAAASFENNPVRDLTLLNKGLWDSDTTLTFTGGASQGARISDEGTTTIEVVSIDEIVGEDRVTFIKLDVEGAEYMALEGARETIKRCHPKLAVSIYHKPEDIFELPELILSMYEGYEFCFRHYQLGQYETILYCI